LVLAAAAGFAGEVVAAVPGPADAIADYPFMLRGGDGEDGSDEFVAEAGDVSACGECQMFEVCGGRLKKRSEDYLRWTHIPLLNMVIGTTDTASMDFDQDLAVLQFWHRDILDLEGLADASEDGCLHSLGNVLRHVPWCGRARRLRRNWVVFLLRASRLRRRRRIILVLVPAQTELPGEGLHELKLLAFFLLLLFDQ
jgi:hypothetical protein